METVLTTRRLCTFHVDQLFLGVDVTDVREVIHHQEMTHVPLACAAIQGLINLRGQIVTAIDLRQRLQLTPRSADQQPMNVVVQTDGDIVSLLVDEIGEVLEVQESDFEGMPETVGGLARELVQGAYKLHDQLLLRLDLKKTLDLSGKDK
jgi:purine-binding chemotaxis protein CheW